MTKNLKIWHLAVIAAVTFGFSCVFFYLQFRMKQLGGNMFDYMVTGYDLSVVRETLAAMGEEGLHIYRDRAWRLDMVYPFFYGLSAIMAWELLCKDAFPKLAWIGTALAIMVILLDYVENLRLGMILYDIQELTAAFVDTTSALTIVKWIVLALLVLGLSILAITRLRAYRGAKIRA